MVAFQKEYVETSDGKKFEKTINAPVGCKTFQNENKLEAYKQSFNLTKYDATDELTVHIFTNKGEEIIIKYEKTVDKSNINIV